MNWRTYADWAKYRPATLRLAGWLGRGRGRFRYLDHLHRPPRAPRRPDLSRWNDYTLAATWIGHATILLRMGDMTILTDPVMFNRVGLGLGLWTGGPTRHIAPALSIRQLPPIDLILVSHAHFDHLDRPTLQRLPKHVPVVTSRHTHDLIHDLGFTSVTELQWGERVEVGSVQITAQPVRHWGARTFLDNHRGFNAYVIEGAGARILYGGDTAFHDGFKSIGKVDLAILGIGAYNPWIQGHANPEQAWEMAQHVRADFVLPMHHSTFKLSYEPMDEPIQRLLTVAGPDEQRVIIREVGGMWARN
jgi:L-ascorbate metabolism protein UlaG (beta-lactamase superfamily)